MRPPRLDRIRNRNTSRTPLPTSLTLSPAFRALPLPLPPLSARQSLDRRQVTHSHLALLQTARCL